MFIFRLALALGKTVEELSRSMTYTEFKGWMQFYEQEPFGFWRDHYHFGMSDYRHAKMMGAKRVKQDDFMPFLVEHKKRTQGIMSPDELAEALRAMGMNVIDNRVK